MLLSSFKKVHVELLVQVGFNQTPIMAHLPCSEPWLGHNLAWAASFRVRKECAYCTICFVAILIGHLPWHGRKVRMTITQREILWRTVSDEKTQRERALNTEQMTLVIVLNQTTDVVIRSSISDERPTKWAPNFCMSSNAGVKSELPNRYREFF